jgi:nucleoside-diphosphate-sugar epimerase
MIEPGLDLHDWETRWQELQELAADEPAETLPEIVRFVEQMLRERRIPLDEPVTAEGDDPDIIRDFLAARDVANAAEAGAADPEDVIVALDNLREIYVYFVTDRAPP